MTNTDHVEPFMPSDPRLSRLDPTRLRVVNDLGIATTLFATEQVPVESAVVNELLDMLQLQHTVERVAEKSPSSFDSSPAIDRVAVTPDFHKAAMGMAQASRKRRNSFLEKARCHWNQLLQALSF